MVSFLSFFFFFFIWQRKRKKNARREVIWFCNRIWCLSVSHLPMSRETSLLSLSSFFFFIIIIWNESVEVCRDCWSVFCELCSTFWLYSSLEVDRMLSNGPERTVRRARVYSIWRERTMRNVRRSTHKANRSSTNLPNENRREIERVLRRVRPISMDSNRFSLHSSMTNNHNVYWAIIQDNRMNNSLIVSIVFHWYHRSIRDKFLWDKSYFFGRYFRNMTRDWCRWSTFHIDGESFRNLNSPVGLKCQRALRWFCYQADWQSSNKEFQYRTYSMMLLLLLLFDDKIRLTEY